MPHVRILRHYIHTPYLIMAVIEMALLVLTAYLGYVTRFFDAPAPGYIWTAILFSAVLTISMVSMGVYESRVREGFVGMTLRTAVSIFLLGSALIAAISFVLKDIQMGRGVLLFSTIEAFVILTLWRWLTAHFINEDLLKRRVLILGTGHRALPIARRMRRKSDRRGFILLGYLQPAGTDDLVSEYDARILRSETSIFDFCRSNNVDEIVVAMDERRRGETNAAGLPLEDLMDCRLSGIDVCDVQAFVEREACKLDVDLLRPSWVVFSDGFVTNPWRITSKRVFDFAASLGLLLLTWPIMLLTALAIWATGDKQEPVLYRQSRIGLNNKPFRLLKFRSMRTDKEQEALTYWTAPDDPRVTRIGAFIRKTRIDELPQLFNVLRGDMSFVGPRPERPRIVEELAKTIPYYEQRHRVKPGITGWAQLCYPYGASVEDAKEKLQYDLYYLKNNSLLLDLIILLQTVEVVLVGEGAR